MHIIFLVLFSPVFDILFSVFLLDLINAYDGGVRSVYGENATSHIFTSYPHEKITKTTGFFDIVSKNTEYFLYIVIV